MTERPSRDETGLTWTVGSAARQLGVPAATLRTWERRHGVGPSHRTAGGHRRYTEDDLDRLRLMARLTAEGVGVRQAAERALGLDGGVLRAELAAGSPDDVELDEEGLVEGLLAATQQLDVERLGQLFRIALVRHGAVGGWTRVLAPALQRIGAGWAEGAIGIHAEHLASEQLTAELRAYARGRGPLESGRATILLASAEDDLHSLPLMALEAALAERGIACHALGPRFPADALARMAERVDPDAVFVWASMPRRPDDHLAAVVDHVAATAVVLLGGPGWAGWTVSERAVRTTGLDDAVARIEATVAGLRDR